jgi:hypothetical protein
VPPGAPAAMRVTHSDSRWAKHAASALVFGKEVTLQTHGHNKYQRTLADVILSNGTNLNQELVKQGFAGGIGGMCQVILDPLRLHDRKTRGASGTAGLAHQRSQVRPRTLCIPPSESTQMATSLTRHENWLGNCLANDAVSVSAMS